MALDMGLFPCTADVSARARVCCVTPQSCGVHAHAKMNGQCLNIPKLDLAGTRFPRVYHFSVRSVNATTPLCKPHVGV